MYTKRVAEHTLVCKKRTLDEMLGFFDEPNIPSKYVKHKQCNEAGCEKLTQNGTKHCISHGGGKRCAIPGCGKSAIGKTDRCIAHKGGRRCTHEDCDKSSRGKTDQCSAHKGGRRCTHEGCDKGTQGKTDRCIAHKGGRRCTHEGCPNGAADKSGRCVIHGGNRCSIKDCPRGAQSKGLCIEHGGGLRCPECIDQVVSRMGSRYYNGMCASCHKHKFPDDPKSKVNFKRMKELAVRKAINDNFEGFIHDKLLYSSCDCPMLRRIDHRTVIDGTLLAIETDEYAHRGYDRKDEVNRYHDIMMSHGGHMLFIRFNPDGKGMTLKKMIQELISELGTQIRRIKAGDNRELLEVVYKFYPQDRKPCFRD